jgi:hypothetical protein
MKRNFLTHAIVALFFVSLFGCAMNKQPEWKPEAFRLKCVDGQLWAYNELGEEIELDDYERECERVEKLNR